MTLDDHEVENNWADEISEQNAPRDEFVVRRANALRACWEHMPMRLAQQPVGPDMQVYRRFRWGDLAEFSVLDTRQYRSDQVERRRHQAARPGERRPGAFDHRRRAGGVAARRPRRLAARWNVIPHQTAIAEVDTKAGPDVAVPMDTWDGYEASRRRILGGIHERSVDNVVFLSGDLHRSLAADLLLDFDDPGSPVVAAELVGTSVTSGATARTTTRAAARSSPRTRGSSTATSSAATCAGASPATPSPPTIASRPTSADRARSCTPARR